MHLQRQSAITHKIRTLLPSFMLSCLPIFLMAHGVISSINLIIIDFPANFLQGHVRTAPPVITSSKPIAGRPHLLGGHKSHAVGDLEGKAVELGDFDRIGVRVRLLVAEVGLEAASRTKLRDHEGLGAVCGTQEADDVSVRTDGPQHADLVSKAGGVAIIHQSI